ncbi:MAG: zinc-ribbon domain-containing protein [Polyangiaceae bacterium]
MKISCQSCQAKYTIADEKVVGKIVKIRCKKCGATIVINGNEEAAAGGGGGVAEDYTAQGDEQWTVNVAEGDQRTMTVQEIVQEYKGGVVTDDTYCWKDGMNDWLPLREIESLYSACTLGPAPALQTSADGFSPISLAASPPAAAAAGASETDTVANVNFGLFGGSNGAENTRTDVSGGAAAGSLFGSSATPSPAAAAAAANAGAAARRQGGRGTGNADLFGTAAQAGSEADVMTSAAGNGAAAGADSKMTGARNENSVLFSLNALTTEPAKGGPSGGSAGGGSGGGKGETTASGDGSGLIDIRALAQSMGVDNKNGGANKVDDIMNLSGGGAFSAALAAPVLAPPTADHSMAPDAPGGQKSKTTLYAIIGGAVFLGLCILGAAFMFAGGKKDKEEETGAKTTPTASDTAAAAPTASATTAAPSTAAAAPTDTGPVAQAPQTGTNTTQAGSTGHSTKPSNGGAVAARARPSPRKRRRPRGCCPAAPSKPKSLAEAMNDSAGTKPAAGLGAGRWWRCGALRSRRGRGGARRRQRPGVQKPDGPTGPGKVKVTFEPSGSVSRWSSPKARTRARPSAECILGKFRGAHIPAFSGAAVTAGKSFSVN